MKERKWVATPARVCICVSNGQLLKKLFGRKGVITNWEISFSREDTAVYRLCINLILQSRKECYRLFTFSPKCWKVTLDLLKRLRLPIFKVMSSSIRSQWFLTSTRFVKTAIFIKTLIQIYVKNIEAVTWTYFVKSCS